MSDYLSSSLSVSSSLFSASLSFRLTKLSAACALGILLSTVSPLSYAIVDGNENGGQIEITGTWDVHDDVHGYFFSDGTDAQGGRVTIEGTISNAGRIAGGRTLYGDAIENSVIINGGNVKSSGIYGGYGQGAHGNRVELKNGAVVQSRDDIERELRIYGAVIDGQSKGSDNHVLISGKSTVNAVVYGAATDNADLSFNTVTVTDSTVSNTGGVLYGAYSARGEVTDNSVTVAGSVIENTSSSQQSSSIRGGYSEAGNVHSNTVSISASKVTANSIYSETIMGGFSSRGNASGNTVSILDNSIVTGNVTGGQAPNGFANNNFVEISNSTVEGDIYGGQSDFGQADGNQVTVTGDKDVNLGSIRGGSSRQSASNNTVILDVVGHIGSVVGGDVENGQANANQVFISGTAHSTNAIIGGWVFSGTSSQASASGNLVDIRGSTVIDGYVAGGFATSGSAQNNVVRITENASINSEVYGGIAEQSAQFNTVIIAGNARVEKAEIFGGYSELNRADNNLVLIQNQSIIGETVIGGVGYAGAAGNSVQIDGGEVQHSVFGGGGSGTISDNTVLINSGDIGYEFTSLIAGGLGIPDSEVKNNQVIIRGGKIHAEVAGGNISNQGTVFNNLVVADGNAVIEANVYGARFNEFNAYSESSVVKIYGNEVVIAGSTEVRSAEVYGAYSPQSADSNSVTIAERAVINGGGVYGAEGTLGASNNSVLVSGGTVRGNIYGGYTQSGKATDNTVLLHSEANLSEAKIYGGFSEQSGEVSGNRLVIADSGVTTQSINHFDTVDINVTDLTQPSLTLTDQDGADLKEAKLHVRFNAAVAGSKAPLEKGTKVTLIDSGDVPLSFSEVSAEGELSAKQGVSLVHQFELTEDGTSATLVSTEVNHDTSILSAGQLGMVGLLTEANRLATGEALKQARDTAEKGYGLYFAASGENLRLDTDKGSEADLDAMHWVLGAANQVALGNDAKLNINFYFEAGSGDVDSDKGQVSGSGDSTYYGVGALLRHEKTDGVLTGLYSQVNAEFGRASMDFDSSLRDVSGVCAGFDKETNYFGLGATLGYRTNLANDISLDLSASYQWLRLKGFSDTVARDSYDFNDIDSHRTIVELQAAYTGNASISPYASLAWEHEFDAETNIKTYGFTLDDLSLKGDTGSAQLGLRYRSSVNSPWSLDASVKGLVGQKEGFAGNVLFNWKF